MNKFWLKFWLKHPSTYVAFGAWGSSNFIGYPTLAGLAVSFFVIIPLLALTIWCAHREGYARGSKIGFDKGLAQGQQVSRRKSIADV
jgi:hypothetical protein